LAQRNEFVSFVIRRVVNPCLQAALHVHRGGRWVDPPGSHKDQHSKRPKKRHSDEKPSNEGSKKAFPMRGVKVGKLSGLAIERRGEVFRALLRGCVWIFNHTSE
jgi:hypothetical protein